MNFKLVFKLTGKVLMVEGICMLLPLLASLIYREDVLPFLACIPVLLIVGFALSRLKPSEHLYAREGFFAVGFIWLILALFGALPFYLSGDFPSYIDCFFEAASGFTTTGATILTAVEGLPHGILFWRSFTHWLGGMGVLVLAIALMPSLGSRTLHLMKAESPGPVVSKLVPKTSQSSKILYGIYCALTVLMVICLKIAGMPLFDSIVNSFATAGTGGFAILNTSIGGYGNPAFEIIITVFMLLFSVNFTLYFLLLCGKWKQVLKNDELRFFAGMVVAATALITINLVTAPTPLFSGFGEALRHAAFQVATIVSTTGFSSTNFDLWPEFSRFLLVTLTFVGACAGSTGGGLKCSRILLLLRSIRREIRQTIHPRSVNVIRLEGHSVEEDTVRSVLVYFAIFVVILLCVSLLISLDGFSFSVNFTAALTCLNNVGPGVDLVGPMGNFAAFSGLSKIVLSLAMITGRLELLPILVLFSKNAWKRT